MKTDVLSDVLRAVHLTGAVFFDFTLTSPWVAEAPPAREIAAAVMPGAQRVIEYHLIAKGEGFGQVVGGEPIRLREGDLILFPRGDAHVIASEPGLRAKPDWGWYRRGSAGLPIVHEQGGGGPARARMICCFLGLDERPYNPLVAALPAVIHIRAGDSKVDTGWLGTLMRMAVSESSRARAGSENVLSRLSELMFVEAIRHHAEVLPQAQTGWLAGLRDPVVGRALAALHGETTHPWTVETLARRAGVSRSVLAERFSEMVDQSPMQYLALWRMQLASRRLAEGDTVGAAASAVGYESEAAFSRAFKKLVGESPSRWRRAAQAATVEDLLSSSAKGTPVKGKG